MTKKTSMQDMIQETAIEIASSIIDEAKKKKLTIQCDVKDLTDKKTGLVYGSIISTNLQAGYELVDKERKPVALSFSIVAPFSIPGMPTQEFPTVSQIVGPSFRESKPSGDTLHDVIIAAINTGSRAMTNPLIHG